MVQKKQEDREKHCLPDGPEAVRIFTPAITDYKHPEMPATFTKLEFTGDRLLGYVPMLDYDVVLVEFARQ